jgi:asparagine synthase (glutamine-hydrolysing)
MLTDLQTYLPGDLLAKVDITSMAHGLECRSPFLDHEFVELAVSIPYHLIQSGTGAKPLLTSTLPDLIPPRLRRRGKMGFRIPLDAWFRGSLRGFAHDVLLSPRTLRRGYFRERQIRSLLQEHSSGRWNHGDRIWALLFLEIWHRTFIDTIEPLPSPVVVSDLDIASKSLQNTGT